MKTLFLQQIPEAIDKLRILKIPKYVESQNQLWDHYAL